MAQQSPRRWVVAVFFIAVASSAGLIVVAWLTNNPIDLRPGEPVTGTLTAQKRSAIHRFEVATGDRVFLRLFQSPELKATMRLAKGSFAVISREDVESGTAVISEVFGGGVWDVRVIGGGQLPGDYELTLEVEPGSEVSVEEELDAESLSDPVDVNGYVLRPAQGGSIEIRVEPDRDDLSPEISVRKGAFTKSVPIGTKGPVAVARVKLDAGAEYVLAVRSLTSKLGLYSLATRTVTRQAVRIPSQVRSVPVPPVFGLNAKDAEAQLTAAGFKVRTISVCSNSIREAGVTRQVVRVVGAEETRVADRDIKDVSLPEGTELVLKATTGQQCGASPPPGPPDGA